MSEPSGLPSAIGIEAVQWLARGESIDVRVQGRWRRRRPSSTGQPLLVIETQGRRHRFPAMPEPPSVTGAAPGTWQMSFSVPASLVPHLAERAWLQLGAVGVPLPLPVQTASGPIPQPAADSEALAERRLRSSELALEAARRRAAEAEAFAHELKRWISELEGSLDVARREPERLMELLAQRERLQRIAEQRAHAERARREELEEEAAERARAATADRSDELAAYVMRVRELEQELARLTRAVDEAEHAARAALAAQRELAARPSTADTLAAGFRAEVDLLRHSAPAAAARLAAAPVSSDFELLRRERLVLSTAGGVRVAEQTISALRHELEARTLAETSLRAQLVTLKARPQPEPVGEAQLGSTLAQLRVEFDGLRVATERETAARRDAERRAAELERVLRQQLARSARAHQAIEQLRVQLEAIRAVAHGAPGASAVAAARSARAPAAAAPAEAPAAAGPAEAPAAPAPREASAPPAPAPAPAPAEPPVAPARVDPERFSAALSRLREAAPRPESGPDGGEAPDRVTGPWLRRAFRTLARADPERAGQLLLALLPAQGLVHPDPLAYDLVLGDANCVRVTVADGRAQVAFDASPREPSSVRFQLMGEPPSIARRLVAGRFRRRLGLGLAKVRGDRASLPALTALVGAPLALHELLDAGVRTDPLLTFTLAGVLIDPSWTADERFVIAYERPGESSVGPYLQVREHRGAAVRETGPPIPVSSTIVCRPEELLPLLAGRRAADVTIRGEPRPVELLQDWLARAQLA